MPNITLGETNYHVLRWPKIKISWALDWMRDSALYWNANDRGIAQDIYKSSISFYAKESVINQLSIDLQVNRENPTFLFTDKSFIFGPHVDYRNNINCQISTRKRKHTSFASPNSGMYILDVDLTAIAPPMLTFASSLSSLKPQDGFEADSSFEVGNVMTYNQTPLTHDARSDIGEYNGVFKQTTAQMQAILYYILNTARGNTIAFPTLGGVTYPFGVNKGGLPLNCKIRSWELNRLDFVFWEIKIKFVENS